MAENLSEVNWFKFALVIFMAATTSMMFNLEDGYIEYVEIWRTMVQTLIAGFAFLQCPANRKTGNEVKE